MRSYRLPERVGSREDIQHHLENVFPQLVGEQLDHLGTPFLELIPLDRRVVPAPTLVDRPSLASGYQLESQAADPALDPALKESGAAGEARESGRPLLRRRVSVASDLLGPVPQLGVDDDGEVLPPDDVRVGEVADVSVGSCDDILPGIAEEGAPVGRARYELLDRRGVPARESRLRSLVSDLRVLRRRRRNALPVQPMCDPEVAGLLEVQLEDARDDRRLVLLDAPRPRVGVPSQPVGDAAVPQVALLPRRVMPLELSAPGSVRAPPPLEVRGALGGASRSDPSCPR